MGRARNGVQASTGETGKRAYVVDMPPPEAAPVQTETLTARQVDARLKLTLKSLRKAEDRQLFDPSKKRAKKIVRLRNELQLLLVQKRSAVVSEPQDRYGRSFY